MLSWICAYAQQPTSIRKIGELDLPLTGLSATVVPVNPVVPKNVAAGVRIVVNAGSGPLLAEEVARSLGGQFQIQGELSGPGLPQTITLPQAGSNAPLQNDRL